jgi:hypothetical protein
MNNLKTTVKVTCSDKSNASPYNGKVVSKLGEIIINEIVKIDVKYYDEEDNFLTRKWVTLDETKSNEIIALISTKVCDAHKLEITNTFELTASQIEEV